MPHVFHLPGLGSICRVHKGGCNVIFIGLGFQELPHGLAGKHGYGPVFGSFFTVPAGFPFYIADILRRQRLVRFPADGEYFFQGIGDFFFVCL